MLVCVCVHVHAQNLGEVKMAMVSDFHQHMLHSCTHAAELVCTAAACFSLEEECSVTPQHGKVACAEADCSGETTCTSCMPVPEGMRLVSTLQTCFG